MKFYAVQIGDDYNWDYGSFDIEAARKLAEIEAEDADNDGKEIRIAIIDTKYNVCDGVQIVREGDK